MNWYHLFLGDDGRLQWETLVTGAAAVLVATVTVFELSKQIRQTGLLAVEQRRRQARAARAALPLALDEIDDYARDCVTKLEAMREEVARVGAPRQELLDWQLAVMPDNVLSVLKECIEFSDDGPAECLAGLIRHYQIQHACLIANIAVLRSDRPSRVITASNLEEDLIYAAELSAIAGSLYAFARSETSKVRPVERKDFHTVLLFSGHFESEEINALSDRWEALTTQRAGKHMRHISK